MSRFAWGLLLLALATSLPAEAAWQDITKLHYSATGERELTNDYGTAQSSTRYKVELRGFPFSVPHLIRRFAGPSLQFHMEMSVEEYAQLEDGVGRDHPIHSPGSGSYGLTYSGLFASPRFVWFFETTGSWSPFTIPGKTYQTHAFAKTRPHLELVIPINVSIPLGGGASAGISADPQNFLPPPGASPLGNSKPWTPRCKDHKDREWSAFDGKCVCKRGEPKDRPNCSVGAGCPHPERMTRDAEGSCICKTEYPIPVRVGTLLVTCLDQGEWEQQRTERRVGENLIRRPMETPEGPVLVELDCVEVLVSSSGTDGSGNPIPSAAGSETQIRCTMSKQPLPSSPFSGEAATASPRRACFQSDLPIGWHPCADDPRPGEPLDLPDVDFRSLLPQCLGSRSPAWCDRVNMGNPWRGTGGSAEADLVVPYLGLSPASPLAGDELELEVLLRNDGGELALAHHYQVILSLPDGSTVARDRYAGSLGPGQDRYLTVRGQELGYPELIEGVHRLTVLTDPLGEVEESSELNNENSLELEVLAGQVSLTADLRASRIRPVDANPLSGAPLELEVEVTNVGSSPAAGTQTLVMVTDPEGNVQAESLTTPSLGPLASETLRFVSSEQVGPGAHRLAVFADSTGQLSEQNELDNILERTIVVADDDLECLPCTSGAANAVGTEVCQDGTAGPWPGLHHVCRGVRSDGTSCANDPNNPNGWEHVGAQCPRPSELPEGWHPNACGEPDVCLGTANP